MASVHLRPIDQHNLRDCLNLQVTDSQTGFVATTAKSLAEAYVDANLVPLVIYDVAARGHKPPDVPMVGFTMYEISTGIGFYYTFAHRSGASKAGVWECNDARSDTTTQVASRSGIDRN
ncbi:MAG: GNAT family N-acetyltransferase [Chloroflexi bacterium AL-W]|nr:GNAT family N-acetyltransferase [Chloroflexi bacterium AL-N1]NOK67683.1 GNAT family N-acetyltransferase [Chloroflexi bacterium AL-N10]NOK75547.1 GNAT family N-acetyltransferase [Chloroflexi bacterium AL-N5]NOK82335.1 GNAT family N-acetyltransferase [Chloroflexi bacterium AL-W]NOK90180.1 GNAT family N-acetyltransferase [Chloroflexi bacterium AL-N15]